MQLLFLEITRYLARSRPHFGWWCLISANQSIVPVDGQAKLTHWGREKNGRHFPDDIYKYIFWKENVKFVPKGPINYIPTLVQIMFWRRPDDNPLSGPMMVRLLTHICVIRPQWVKSYNHSQAEGYSILNYAHQHRSDFSSGSILSISFRVASAALSKPWCNWSNIMEYG